MITYIELDTLDMGLDEEKFRRLIVMLLWLRDNILVVK